MLKLKSNKGFTLIEVLCSLCVFSILFLSALTMQINSYKIEKYYKEFESYCLFEEYVKNNLIYNCTYDEIQQLKAQNRFYISNDNIKLNNIENAGFTDMFVSTVQQQKPYAQIDIQGDKVLKINLKLYMQIMNKKEVMECEFYKGKYKK